MSMTVEQTKQAVAEKWGYPYWEALVNFAADGEHAEAWKEVYSILDAELALLSAELEKHRWIPVEEKLPMKTIQVLIFLKGGWILSSFLDLEKLSPRERDAVTHWRYLPELP